EPVGEPGPADLAEERVLRDLGLHPGTRHHDDTEGAVPCLLALGVVEHDETSRPEQVLGLTGAVDLTGQRERVRRDARRGRDLLQVQLGSETVPSQAEQRGLEVRWHTDPAGVVTVSVRPWRLLDGVHPDSVSGPVARAGGATPGRTAPRAGGEREAATGGSAGARGAACAR